MDKPTKEQIKEASKIANKGRVIPTGLREETWLDAMRRANEALKFIPLHKGLQKIKSIEDIRGKKK